MNNPKALSTKPSLKHIFWLSIRPKTLPASLSPVVLGTALVPAGQLNWLLALSAFGCALFLQISVNLANDFFDAKSGVDTDKRLGPVRVTQSGLASPTRVAIGIALFIILSIICGLILVAHSDALLLGVGVLCVLAALGYSGGPYPMASHGLGEIAVLIFFGWVAVMGSYYVHTHALNWQLFILANALGFILSAIMLVNNIRDIPTDTLAGKNTLAVMLGEKRSKQLYSALLIGCIFLHSLAFTIFKTDVANFATYLQLGIPLILLLPLSYLAHNYMQESTGRELNRLLAYTATLSLIYSVSVSLLIQI